jgi:peptidoglycan/xylan/chitin deacetylase (PgdA/CDA1 family)
MEPARLLAGLGRKAGRHLNTQPFRMRNHRPLASFTFDDVPASAARAGADLLNANGAFGTFYIAAGLLGTRDEFWDVATVDDVRRLHATGHEIGDHTFSHPKVDEISAETLEEEENANRAALREICGDLPLENFAFPFGRQTLSRKLQLQRRFATCRSVYEGLNVGRIDLAMLRVIELYDRTLTPEKLARTLDAAAARNAWVIFYTHDVADPPSWIGASPALFDRVLKTVADRGFDCVTIAQGLRRIGARP